MNENTTTKSHPLISCLCITYKRPEFLARAIEFFLHQTHKNKELIIVHNERDVESLAVLKRFNSAEIKSVSLAPPRKLTIGELRNIAIESSTGEYICTWDDDDWHSPHRLTSQLACIQKFKKPASILSRVLMYDNQKNNSYLSTIRAWEFTLMVDKKTLMAHQIRYLPINRAEDYYFVNDLIKHNLVYPLLDPLLYIYHASGINTCEPEHFQRFFSLSEKLLSSQTLIIKKAINCELSPDEAAQKMQNEYFLNNLRYIPIETQRV